MDGFYDKRLAYFYCKTSVLEKIICLYFVAAEFWCLLGTLIGGMTTVWQKLRVMHTKIYGLNGRFRLKVREISRTMKLNSNTDVNTDKQRFLINFIK